MDTIAISLSGTFWVLWAIGITCWIIFLVKDHKHNKNDPGPYWSYEGEYPEWLSEFNDWRDERKRIRRWHTAFYVFLITAIIIQFIRIIVTA